MTISLSIAYLAINVHMYKYMIISISKDRCISNIIIHANEKHYKSELNNNGVNTRQCNPHLHDREESSHRRSVVVGRPAGQQLNHSAPDTPTYMHLKTKIY